MKYILILAIIASLAYYCIDDLQTPANPGWINKLPLTELSDGSYVFMEY